MKRRLGVTAKAKIRKKFARQLFGGRAKKLSLSSTLARRTTASINSIADNTFRAHSVRPAAVLDAVQKLATLMRDFRGELTEEKYAELLGVTKRDVMLWERGYLVPDEEIAKKTLEHSSRFENGWGLYSSLDLINHYIKEARRRDSDRSVLLEPISARLMEELRRRPALLFGLSSRKFEEVIAEIFESFGADVSLTPNGQDRGRDIFAVFNTPVGNILTLVQCKRYAPDRKVGRPILTEFLYTIRDQDRASLGLIATTSAFSREAEILASENQWQLKLADFEHISKWLEKYGNWNDLSGELLWTPG